MSTTRYKIRLWEYDGEASVANAVTFDSFDEAQARFNDLRVSEEMPCVEFIKERIANGCIIGDEVLNVRQFTSVFDAICVCPALCLQSAPKSVFFRTGKRAKARNMNSAKQWRRTSRFSSSLIGNGRDHRMQKNKMPVPTEAQEQMTLFSWAAMQSGKYPELNLLYHVPNGGSRHKAEAGRLRAEGVKAGVPDLCLPVARGQYHGLYIELKRQRGGRTSDHQSEWLDALSAQGYKAALCYGWEQAAGTIIEYLTGGGTHD